MNEKNIASMISNGWKGCGMENGKIIVKLEGYIEGRQASLMYKILSAKKDSEEYAELVEQLRKLEEKSGFMYDLSPTRKAV
ncbi:MAG: hypothetical protein K6E34_12965 [Lachnospiraceae bacterium]|nr:hypothetical protein [Lachnospiraceae bacterium]